MSEDVSLGYLILVQADSLASPLPLEHTSVRGEVLGGAATVGVAQRFGNPYAHPIEAQYVFPLPHKAAISDYSITIGARTIRADVRERQAARRSYEEAQAEGKRASLLDQQRPNLFAIRVANIQPGESILCELQYDETLTYKDGAYEFVFPMGITPRYHTPSLPADPSVDAPLALPGAKISPVEIALTIRGAVGDPVSKSHPIAVTRGEQVGVTLAGEHIPDKDFVLRFDVAADTVRPSAWAARATDGNEIALVSLLPPRTSGKAEPGKREFIFVIDRSGSMMGDPIEQARNALKTCLRMLNPDDTFYLLVFDDKLEWFAHTPTTLTQEHVDAADAWIDSVAARGGTEILGAVKAALGLPVDVERKRYVVFLTDGAVSAEESVLRDLIAKRGAARIFTFGLGSSVNRYLISKMAEMGRGWAEFLGLRDDIEKAITRFQDRVSYPALIDLQLEWIGANAWDTYPDVLPDLYVGQPLDVVTRFARNSDEVKVIARGQRGGEALEFSTVIPAGDPALSLLNRLWARERIEALMNMRPTKPEETRQQIIELALKYRLLSQYTSFVAVDSEVTTGGKDELVRVAVPLPEGLKYEGFLGGGIMAMASMAAPSPASSARHIRSRAMMVDADEDDLDSYLNAPQEKARGITASWARTSAKDIQQSIRRDVGDLLSEMANNETDLQLQVKELARKQKINGSWLDRVDLTALALTIFIKAGHTTTTGDYRAQVRKAAQWLVEQLKLNPVGKEAAQRTLQTLEAATGEKYL